MASKNKSLVAGLVTAMDPGYGMGEAPARLASGVLSSRSNRLAELASGAVVNMPQELVDPARCRIWSRHNRDYGALDERRCADLIESIQAQGKQEVPAIVRRVSGDPNYDFEVICGARRHWTVSWLRAHHHPDIRYLIEIRELTDEQAFRISDLENRARVDLSDVERARDYLQALDLYYDSRQKEMARRLNQSEAWLSRYLDLARFPSELMCAFTDPFELKISHVGALKPLLKDDASRAAVLAEARRLAEARSRQEAGIPVTVPDVIRSLAFAANQREKGVVAAPKKSGNGATVIKNQIGLPVIRVDGKDRKGLTVTLLLKGGGSRADAEFALKELLDHHWRE